MTPIKAPENLVASFRIARQWARDGDDDQAAILRRNTWTSIRIYVESHYDVDLDAHRLAVEDDPNSSRFCHLRIAGGGPYLYVDNDGDLVTRDLPSAAGTPASQANQANPTPTHNDHFVVAGDAADLTPRVVGVPVANLLDALRALVRGDFDSVEDIELGWAPAYGGVPPIDRGQVALDTENNIIYFTTP